MKVETGRQIALYAEHDIKRCVKTPKEGEAGTIGQPITITARTGYFNSHICIGISNLLLLCPEIYPSHEGLRHPVFGVVVALA